MTRWSGDAYYQNDEVYMEADIYYASVRRAYIAGADFTLTLLPQTSSIACDSIKYTILSSLGATIGAGIIENSQDFEHDEFLELVIGVAVEALESVDREAGKHWTFQMTKSQFGAYDLLCRYVSKKSH